MKQYDLVVFIGRFQPFHNSHLKTIKMACGFADDILVIVGSANKPSTFKNPFGTQTVCDFVKDSTKDLDSLVHTVGQEDIYGDVLWCKSVQEKVQNCLVSLGKDPSSAKVGIIGCNKDDTTYYLKMFPQWDWIEVPLFGDLSATKIRELYFVENPNLSFIQGVLPEYVFQHLGHSVNTEWHEQVVRERRFIEKYKSQFAGLPYDPAFVTTDAVIFQSGHVLMVKRSSYPGKGLMALPGGFLNAATDLTLEDAMIRELREETRLKVPDPVLRGSVKKTHVFDSIDRSSRGRTITHAFNIVLPDGPLPKVKGSSDAEKAFWVPLSEVKSQNCFEDHYQIIQFFI